MKSQGLPQDAFDGRPVIGICNTWSELTPCNAGLHDVADHVKRGVWEAGGVPLEFPAISLGETQMRPTAMLFCNLLAMEVEEILFDGPKRRLELLVTQEDLARRAQVWQKRRPAPKYSRGYYSLYVQHVLQADRGCDLDFLTGASGSTVERESH
jgi:dihydroxyacid dehydratase/phosphogluconate dehydratase